MKQQRSHEVYKLKEQKHTCELSGESSLQQNDDMEIRLNGNTQISTVPKSIMKNSANNSNSLNGSSSGNSPINSIATNDIEETIVTPKKPIQKVTPSRNTELMSSVKHTNDVWSTTVVSNGECISYIKPNSPMKSLNGANDVGGGHGLAGLGMSILTNNNKFTTIASSSTAGGIKSPVGNSTNKIVTGKAHR